MKHITIVTGCFNEVDNVGPLFEQICEVMAGEPDLSFNVLYMDNCSTDGTSARLREMAARDPRVQVIVNARNFGPVRSPYHGLLQARGDAVVLMASDLQDPPALLAEFILHWKAGAKVVVGVKPAAIESWLMFRIRRMYYRFITRIADVELLQNFTGFGLYDRKVVDELRKIDDPYPYFRGLISEIGFKPVQVPFVQPPRIRGITKNNFYSLYDMAMLGITSQSRLPLRIATMAGFGLSAVSLAVSVVYLLLKLLFWNYFTVGVAPLLIGMFFFASVQLFFIGLLGEYVGTLLTLAMKRPLVVEAERINLPDA